MLSIACLLLIYYFNMVIRCQLILLLVSLVICSPRLTKTDDASGKPVAFDYESILPTLKDRLDLQLWLLAEQVSTLFWFIILVISPYSGYDFIVLFV